MPKLVSHTTARVIQLKRKEMNENPKILFNIVSKMHTYLLYHMLKMVFYGD